MSNHSPKKYTEVSAYATLRDTKGHAIPGVRVYFTWKYKTVTHTVSAKTNKYGRAISTRYIASATKGFKVVVAMKASSGGSTVRGSSYFIAR